MRHYSGEVLELVLIETFKKEIKKLLSERVKKDFHNLASNLKGGLKPTMPVARKLFGIGDNIFELRLSDSQNSFRLVYYVHKRKTIYFVHCFIKKSQKTPKKQLDLCKKRIRRIKYEI